MTSLFERFTSRPVTALTLVDRFARLQGSRGPFPPPIGGLQFSFVAKISQGGEASLRPPIILNPQRSGSGVFLFPSEGRIGPGPLLSVPPDRYKLRITSEFYQDDLRDVTWPADPSTTAIIELNPGSAYPFPDGTVPTNELSLLRGNVFAIGSDAKPIPGATVTLKIPDNTWPFANCRTDANGGWVLAIPLVRTAPPFDATLHFALPDGTGFDVRGVPVRPGEETSLPQTALRGVVLSQRDAPIPNAVVTFAGIGGTSVTKRSGEWSFYLGLTQLDAHTLVTATAPGGRSQSQQVQVRHGATVTVPAFRIATD
jgi:hypothetical protein